MAAPDEPRWRSVWIVGASTGIGAELARRIAGEVVHVAISARSQDKLEALAETAPALSAYPLDVTDAGAVAACAGEIEAAQGPLDLVVLSAGAWSFMGVDTLDLEKIRKGVDVNIMGVMNALAAILPGMLERGRGHIAIVASVAGYRGLPKSIAYGPTKAALINLAENLHAELKPRGITVSLVNPGFVDTPMTQGNPFPMPSIISAGEAADALLKGLRRGDFEIVFPRGFVFVMKLIRLLPNALYFWVVRHTVQRGGEQHTRS